MLCADLMTTDVSCVPANELVRDAAEKMRDKGIGFLPVCDAEGVVIGVVTDRDLAVRALADGLETTARVEDVMSRDIVALSPLDDVRRAEQLMAERQIQRILVTDDEEHLQGVISLSDIARGDDDAHVAWTVRSIAGRSAHDARH